MIYLGMAIVDKLDFITEDNQLYSKVKTFNSNVFKIEEYIQKFKIASQ